MPKKIRCKVLHTEEETGTDVKTRVEYVRHIMLCTPKKETLEHILDTPKEINPIGQSTNI